MSTIIISCALLCLTLAFSQQQSTNNVLAPQPSFWPRYTRPVALLDGQWNFGLSTDENFDSLDPKFDPSTVQTLNKTSVPSCFDVAGPGVMGTRGVGFYRTTFQLKENTPARLQFGGCAFFCRVYVDNKEIGYHKNGGYSMFFLDVVSSSNESRQLFVLADNRFNHTTAPLHTGGDFWNYGGLLRSVVLHELPRAGQDPFVWRVEVKQAQGSEIQAGDVELDVYFSDRKWSGKVNLSIAFDDKPVATVSGNVVNGLLKVAAQVPVASLWSINTPNLHTVSVFAEGQGVIERFGLRQFSVSNRRIALNGEVVKLHGWNHHTQWPDTGAAPTDAQLDQDLALLEEGGCTYVRGAHYPQDPRWLDRLDEAGMVMWEETLGPGTSVTGLNDWEGFMQYQMAQLEEMVSASFNHASIMTWGFFNEGPSDNKAACAAYKNCSDFLNARDSTRFVTWASDKENADVCLDYATLVSFNHYPAWYDHMGDLTAPAAHWNSMAAAAQEMQPGKPFVISETGAGGIYEWSQNTTDAQWTIKYQTEVLVADVKVALSNANISGVTLWHFFDFKGNDQATESCGPCQYEPQVFPPTCAYINVSCGRPGGENHKGVVDMWRRLKAGFTAVGTLYNGTGAN